MSFKAKTDEQFIKHDVFLCVSLAAGHKNPNKNAFIWRFQVNVADTLKYI